MSALLLAERARRGSGWWQATAVLAARNRTTALRRPNALIAPLLQPTVFLLLVWTAFSGVFEIETGGLLIDQLAAVMVAAAAVFTAMTAGGSLALDLEAGVMDRLRSLPIPGSAVLASRVVEAAVRMLVACTLVVAVAFALGLRFAGGVAGVAGFVALAVLFGVAWTCLAVAVAVWTGSFDAVSAAMFLLFFPVFFVSGAVVPVDVQPDAFAAVAAWSPLTAVTEAMRSVAAGAPDASALLAAAAWSGGLIVVAGGLAAARFARFGR